MLRKTRRTILVLKFPERKKHANMDMLVSCHRLIHVRFSFTCRHHRWSLSEVLSEFRIRKWRLCEIVKPLKTATSSSKDWAHWREGLFRQNRVKSSIPFNPQFQKLARGLPAELSAYSRLMKAGAFNLFGSAQFRLRAFNGKSEKSTD